LLSSIDNSDCSNKNAVLASYVLGRRRLISKEERMPEYTAYLQPVNEQDGDITELTITHEPGDVTFPWSSLASKQWGPQQSVDYLAGFGDDADQWAVQFRASDGKVYVFEATGSDSGNAFRQCNIEAEDANGTIVFAIHNDHVNIDMPVSSNCTFPLVVFD
jgi:hypothetical protein